MTTTYTYHTSLDQIATGNRNFIISIDGTGNDPSDATERGSDVTNVRRFHMAIAGDDGNQFARYFPGVGTEERKGLLNRVAGLAFGAGAHALRDEAYVVLVTNFRPGDRIFITGFSRGAAIARMLANLIREKGIPEAITISKNDDGKIVDYKNRGKKANVKIEMLGVWDTVASFGIPVRLARIDFQKINLFTNLTIASNIKKAYHLVSVDENRDAFQPTLMNHDPRRIQEIWFPGVHSDVGGGYDLRRLADITLEFMIDKARRLGVTFDPDALDEIQPNPDGRGVLHRHPDRPGHYRLSPRKLVVMKDGKPDPRLAVKIHETVFRRTEVLGTTKYNPKNVKTAMKRPFKIVKRDVAD